MLPGLLVTWALLLHLSSTISHSPGDLRFTHPIYNVTIPENSVGKVYARQPPGEDTLGLRVSPDSNIEVRYRIINGDKNKFFKAEERQVGDFCFLSIRIRTGNSDVLNRERKDKYTLEVRASASKRDGKNKIILEADTTVIVKISDTNDLSPLFYPTEYSVTIPEDTPLHRSIVKVSAEDADLGFNGEIYYSFLEETDQFSIHPSSGVVSITRPLTLTERSYHEIVVLGKDRGALSHSGTSTHAARAMLTIRVKQVNLHGPEIYVHHFTDIVENSHSDICAIVRVVDKDNGIHGQIKSLDIVNGDPDGHFRIHATDQLGEFNIVVHSLLDREKTPQGYNLTLRAVDRGTPPKQSYKSVPIHLADVNDNSPVFHKEIYEVNVPETAPINTPVIRLKVTDADIGKNAQVFLEIVGGNEGGEFYVNPATGMLYTAAILDAETKAFYTITVSAIDQGNTGTRKQSSAKVKINVIDTNDNDPLFERAEVVVYLDENESAGTSVTKVTARDRDSGENAYISYSIANLNPVPFEIDHFSGIVKTTQVLDYESMRREYVLRVRASDWGLPYRRQTEMQLVIRIKDINDNRPQFEKVDCSGHVSRHLTVGSEIITLNAIDLDARSLINYRILSGNDDGCFNLDPSSGVLSVSCDLKEVKSDDRELNITASDGTHYSDGAKVVLHLVHSKKALSSIGRLLSDEKGLFQCKETGVAARLADMLASAEKNNLQGREVSQEEFAMMPSRYGENVHSPEFYDFPLEIKVNESVQLGTTLTRLKARDRDLGYNGKLIFGISGGDQDSVFRIDPETGDLKVIGYLDREREYQYLLNMSVYDLGKPQKGVSRLLPITVLDVNDNPPKFMKSLGNYRISENALNGSIICKMNASDADSGEYSKIKYSLVTDTQDFGVDPLSGIVSVLAKLDRERQSVYELKIRARDNGGLYSDALVRITIDDVNDNAPQFSLPAFTVKIREDVPRGSVVAIVGAMDPDLGPGGDLVYSIVDKGELDDYFKIDSMTGTLRVSKLLDFEERQVHTVVVRASDRGTPPLSAETTVTIEIIDVNENVHQPVFDDFVLEGSVSENQPIGTKVFTVKATDADPPGMDSRINYSIRSGDGMGYFTIDNEGQIRTLAVLDTETRDHYWLTVCAQDQGVVPQHSCVKVYIVVEDENDCVPLTLESWYSGSVPESAPGGRAVLQLQARDADATPTTLSYKVVSGDPGGLFHINSTTGVLTTTGRLDRESQSQHWLDIQVSDDGTPQLSSITRVQVVVTDVNDNSPIFLEQYYLVKIPAHNNIKMLRDKSIVIKSDDVHDESIAWEAYSNELKGSPLFQILAYDEDEGINSEITYSAKSGKGKNNFFINPEAGFVFSSINLEAGSIHELNIRAADNGVPPKVTTTRVGIEVIPIPDTSANPPVVKTTSLTAKVTESDKIGFLVSTVQAFDDDNDTLWYKIIDGDKENRFYIGRETGNVVLAKKLIWENQSNYNLNISVTDGVHIIYVKLNVIVINDVNEDGPIFSQSSYVVNVSENFAGATPILSLRATGQENLIYTLFNARSPISLNIFRIDSITGDITIREPLDRETMEEHILTVMVKDQAIKSKRNYTRVLVRVYDHNDHAPEFNSKIIQGKVFETSPIGTSVIKVQASDKDKGENAIIHYSISSGNLGNIFSIDPEMGDITLSFELDLSVAFEYMLQVKASNPGPNPLSTTVPVHIMVTMADNARPRFLKQVYSVDIYENDPSGTFVEHVEARSTSSLNFDIIKGDPDNMFDINPSTGVILTKYPLDYEYLHLYNITVTATNMGGLSTECFVIIHVLDRNDNCPRFLVTKYKGNILESAPVSSLVFSNASTRLVITTEDIDSGLNSLKMYEIVESIPRKYFHIDSTTGAVRTIKLLDYETIDVFNFHVRVYDLGKPTLSSDVLAQVQINVLDVNDCPPKFEQHDYNTTLILPTYKNVAVITLIATDGDKNQKGALKYDIIDGDKKNIFAIDPLAGTIIVLQPEKIKQSYKLHVRVSDGKFSSITQVYISIEKSESSKLKFQKPFYEGNVMENSTKIVTVTVVNVIGSVLNEHIQFNILNPTDMFTIGLTSGAIQTTGVKFDREIKDNYVLIIEAKSMVQSKTPSHAVHCVVNVTVMDVNDNCPMFVNLPYYAIVSVDDQKGHVIAKVHAIDLDSLENGEVRYEMKRGHGELFKVCRKTGEISLKQNLEGHNKEYQLIIGAYDGGVTPCYSETTVSVKVVDRSMPVFDKQFYSISVLENVEIMTPLGTPLLASSPLGRKLIYSIVRGNDKEKFTLDFNTAPDSNNGPCIISATEELDFEEQYLHQLTVRATDSVTGVYAEVSVSIVVDDVNDNPPEFTADSYHISVSESASFGTMLVKLEARDNDTGINQELVYSIPASAENTSSYFYIDPIEGIIYLKKSLDREIFSSVHFTAVATDKGIPALSSTVHVWVTVSDMNDNPPQLEQTVYNCVLSEHADRGQFVTRVAASDVDLTDRDHLSYSIVGGNERQTFSINNTNGIINLINIEKFGKHPLSVLNVSVTDGVYTTFSRVKITLQSANRHNPHFKHAVQEVSVIENKPPGFFVYMVKAEDEDFGEYGTLSYSIHSNILKEIFSINSQTGELTTLIRLDREIANSYDLPIMVVDGGGRPAITMIRIKVEDENDNMPKFIYKEYKTSIYINQSLSVPFLHVKAVDSDDGINAEIQYSIYNSDNSGVNEIFGVDPNTGAISLLDDSSSLESQTYKFWIRAIDSGIPSLYSDVSVEIYIMSAYDVVPSFDMPNEKFFIVENSPQGTVIAHLKMSSTIPVTFRILPAIFDSSLFYIDDVGQLIVSGSIDRETTESFLIGVLAETLNSPALVAFTEISLNVIDENDNAPMFHSSPMFLNLAENIEQGSTIMRAMADDKDFGSNGEVRFALGADMGDVGNVFAIDPYTGWITTLVELDRETQPIYKFQILAIDNAHQKHISRATIIIRLKDYNDCPPVFVQKKTHASVNEDAQPGTVVLQLEITDEDFDIAPVEYYIISGDVLCQFHIRTTGELYVTKTLDRESIPLYKLDIIATDGRHTAITTLTVDVLDANDNPPYCLRHRYYKTIPENCIVGTSVLTVLASDADQEHNAQLRYFLSGFKSEHFTIDKNTGELKTAVLLDRELYWKYNLIAHVQDKEKISWECSSEIQVTLSDVNDNAPQFSIAQYSVTLPEDVEIGTLVMKVHASDKDLGINRRIRYSFVDDLQGQFAITADSGIVTVLTPLDRETQSTYNFDVRATDLGKPSLWNQVSIQLAVSDVNDNPPEFSTKYYYANVLETSQIGKEVVRVLATSKDTGVNADIFYSIIGGNDHKKFGIDAKTGVITIIDALDYERSKEYILTIQAMDRGVPPLSNLASVNVSISDSNDNAPVFTQNIYNTQTREDAEVSDRIFQVIANDLDSGSNGKIIYSIEKGDNSRKFIINSQSGMISLTSLLDRESHSFYTLIIQARDHGIPVLSSTAIVNIEVTDANDNPPLFSQSNYSFIIQEDKPVGHLINEFIINDLDISPNAAPYIFDIRSGNEDITFVLEQDGFLRTGIKFNHKMKNKYVLQIRVFDNGTPPLYSDTTVNIRVIEESQYPPVITALEININSFRDEYEGGLIGKVFAFDQDLYDVLTYNLVSSQDASTTDLFNINEKDGVLYALPQLDIGDYKLNVSVTDGKFISYSTIRLNMELITEEMLKNAVIIRFRDVGAKSFVTNHRKGFLRTVRNALNCHLKDVIIISIQQSSEDANKIHHKSKRSMNIYKNVSLSENLIRKNRRVSSRDLDVLFSVKKQSAQGAINFYTSEAIRKSLNNNLEELEESTKLVVEEMVRLKCNAHYCAYGECQEKFLLDQNKPIPIITDVNSLVCPYHLHKAECKCHDGYGGERCETIVNECARKPCPDNEKCFPDQTIQGYNCRCVDKLEEGKCHLELSKCHGGNCFKPLNPIHFNGKSYAQYKIGKETFNGKRFFDDLFVLTFKIRTVNPSGSLMFAIGKIDYNILEISNGIVQYRLELGSGEGIIRVSSVKVSDGRWHEVKLERDGRSAHLTVDNKHVAHGSAPGMNGILNLHSDDLYFGAEVTEHPAILGLDDVRRGFVGCLGDIYVSNEIIPLHNGGVGGSLTLKKLTNVEFNCPANMETPGPCGNLPCLNGGSCKTLIVIDEDSGPGYKCQCHERYSGQHCEIDSDPCASQPCLYGGLCTVSTTGFECSCPNSLKGNRCELGKWCVSDSSTCRHGGLCEEGDSGPACRCHGYHGPLCEFDIDECKGDPCLNGATCINEPGSFRCVCPPDKTGMHCGNPLHSDAVTSGVYELLGRDKLLWLMILTGGACILILICTILLSCYKKQNEALAPESKPTILNSTLKQPGKSIIKRGSKLSNLEAQCAVDHPAAYTTIGSTHDAIHSPHTILNNMDILRNYGAAGDELENIPSDYRRNLNRDGSTVNTPTSITSGNNEQPRKVSWSEQMHIQSFQENRINNDLTSGYKKDDIISPPTGYHWDCTDWRNNAVVGGLSDIAEVPGSEIADSSSYHSNDDSSEYVSSSSMRGKMINKSYIGNAKVDDVHDIVGNNESDCVEDNYELKSASNYHLHPNAYLPCFTYSSTDGETEVEREFEEDSGVEPYGFPSSRRKPNYKESDIDSVITMLEERSSLLGSVAGAISSLSVNVCDLEDAENNSNLNTLQRNKLKKSSNDTRV